MTRIIWFDFRLIANKRRMLFRFFTGHLCTGISARKRHSRCLTPRALLLKPFKSFDLFLFVFDDNFEIERA